MMMINLIMKKYSISPQINSNNSLIYNYQGIITMEAINKDGNTEIGTYTKYELATLIPILQMVSYKSVTLKDDKGNILLKEEYQRC